MIQSNRVYLSQIGCNWIIFAYEITAATNRSNLYCKIRIPLGLARNNLIINNELFSKCGHRDAFACLHKVLCEFHIMIKWDVNKETTCGHDCRVKFGRYYIFDFIYYKRIAVTSDNTRDVTGNDEQTTKKKYSLQNFMHDYYQLIKIVV